MSDVESKRKIESALHDFSQGDLFNNTTKLFNTMGYTSRRFPIVHSFTPAEFLENYNRDNRFKPERALCQEWQSVHFIFQVTKDEIKNSSQLGFDFGNKNQVDTTIIESYLFFAIELDPREYTRTELAEITRQINKAFDMPVMLLFKHGASLTFSIIDRRPNKIDTSKDVLKKVTLIKDIDFADPHRAHIEILFDLSIDALYRKHSFTNFVELHRAWEKTLDSSELNKTFFKELSNWYFWALQNVTFPKDAGEDREIRNATSVIRLLTRLIFIWFIKEKGLVPDELFNQHKLNSILKYVDPQKSTYYKAILQNLFFATLNQEMNTSENPDIRRFRGKNKQADGRDQHFGITNLYRYENYFHNPNEALELFSKVPFLNGGLFECLDKPDKDDPKKMLRIDGFSDHKDNEICVPDFLLFTSEEHDVDLNEAYGTGNKHYKVRGLINLLERYKFTINENTPIEEEVALDPELLGKAFENLLASYNPETKTTARKATGSYYTPREIVNYMMDESLIAYLAISLKEKLPEMANTDGLEEILREVFAYKEHKEEGHYFNATETYALIEAIDNIKVLDPACGSGAFPMGVLHKLVFILGKLDPHNTRWKERQLANAQKFEDPATREKAIADIEDSFQRNEMDYGRKLYLIQNCIYGVDIQPIAAQISKLRFFISLIVDQKVEDKRENRGILALPNLETKFVAANTLIGLDKPKPSNQDKGQQGVLRTPAIIEKEERLKQVRQRYFTARTQKTKQKCKDDDSRLRSELANLLVRDGMLELTAEKLAKWDPYDQNTHAEWFNPEWMFGVSGVFDVVIANPPYVEFKNLSPEIKNTLLDYRTTRGKYDLYIPFIEKSGEIIRTKGISTFICPTRFMKRDYGSSLRKWLAQNFGIIEIVDFGDVQMFECAMNYTGILIFGHKEQSDTFRYKRFLRDPVSSQELEISLRSDQINESVQVISVPHSATSQEVWSFHEPLSQGLISKIKENSQPLKDLCDGIFQGIATGKDSVFVVDEQTINQYKIENGIMVPFLKGKDIGRYNTHWSGNYVIYPYNRDGSVYEESEVRKRFPYAYKYLTSKKDELKGRQYFDNSNKRWYELWNQRNLDRFLRTKIVTLDNAKCNSFALDKGTYMGTTTTYSIILKNKRLDNYLYILGVLNSSVIEFYHKNNTIPQAGGFYRYQAIFINSLPIRFPKDISPYINLVSKILGITENDDYSYNAAKQATVKEYERQIDQMVYELYGLTPEEIVVVEGKK
ncbi:MAG: Eco57I restriction-modification methylase domain-containing protein [Deltaproteobacteria bacterium]|nr:Eco57I restriction-modification methylase domain-containing protein [Deltaproteobacteria bacterium]